MADAKKTESKPMTDAEATERIVSIIVFLLLLGAVASALLDFIENFGIYGAADSLWERIVQYFLDRIWPKWKIFAALISGLAIWGIFYNQMKLSALNALEATIFSPSASSLGAAVAGEVGMAPVVANEKKTRWEKILEDAHSDNPADWKLAILEADAMLDDVLRGAGYAGDSVGEMLKTANKEDFVTLDQAWEAHKIRNRIAHSGQGFEIDRRETKRVIALFEIVFKEFRVI